VSPSNLTCFICFAAGLLALVACGEREVDGRLVAGDSDREPQPQPSILAIATDDGVVGVSPMPTLKDHAAEAPLRRVFEKTDPAKDPDWESESLAEAAKQQLKALGKRLIDYQDEAALGQDFSALVSPSFRGGALRPALSEVFNDGSVAVLRSEGDGESAGGLGFISAVASWRGAFRQDDAVDAAPLRWKIVRMDTDREGGAFASEVRLETDGLSASGGRVSQVVELKCEWLPGGDHPLLAGWDIRRFEEVRMIAGDDPVRPPFVDETASLLGKLSSYRDQLSLGADYWYGNLDVAFGIQQGNQGISVGDANGDGREDLFVCQPAGLPSHLYLQAEDGSLREWTEEAGLDWLDDVRSALFIDLDNDGDEDLALGLGYSLTLFENDGAGRFALRVEVDMFSWPSSIAAADYDGDGDLDIYVCGYTPRDDVAPGDIFANPVPYHDANNGARNFFIENQGAFDFVDVTAERGLSENNRRFSFAASWEDYDLDGDPDLYVANDFGRNNLYRNDEAGDGSRHFVDVAVEAGVEDIAAGMSVSWGDYNRDGNMDLYVSNMFSSAGGRIAFQQQFQEGAGAEVRAGLQRHSRGNSLFENLGDGRFKDVSEAAGVTMGRWAWSSRFVDLNNDAWEDLVVANGFFTTEDSDDL